MLKTKFTIASLGDYTIFKPDLASLSAAWSEFRNQSGVGSSDIISGGDIMDDSGVLVGHMSYNGKVWPRRDWKAGDVPVFDPFA